VKVKHNVENVTVRGRVHFSVIR